MFFLFMVLCIFLKVPYSELAKNVERDPPLSTPYSISFWLARSSKELMLLLAFLAGDKPKLTVPKTYEYHYHTTCITTAITIALINQAYELY